MTSIGRLLVVISIGEPHERHVTVMGDVGGAYTGVDGDGATSFGGLGALGARRPPARISITNRRITRIRAMMPRMSPAVPARFPPPILTTSRAAAPLFAS